MVGPPADSAPRCAAASTPRASPLAPRRRTTPGRTPGETHFPGVRRARARFRQWRRLAHREPPPHHGTRARAADPRSPRAGRIARRAERQRADAALRRGAQQARCPLPRRIQRGAERLARGAHTYSTALQGQAAGADRPPPSDDRRGCRMRLLSGVRSNWVRTTASRRFTRRPSRPFRGPRAGRTPLVAPCRGPVPGGGGPTPSCAPL